MKVWMISHFAMPPGESGITRHYSLARVLKQHGIEPTIIAGASNYQTSVARLGAKDPLLCLQEIGDVRFLWLNVRMQSKRARHRLLAWARFSWLILTGAPSGILSKPEVIFASSPDLFSAAAACAYARLKGIPFILEIRDLWPDSWTHLLGFKSWHPVILFMRALEWFVYSQADHIVSLLSEAAPYFARHGGRKTPVTIIPNGLDTELLQTSSTPERQGFTVMYAGAVGVANHVETLVEAARLLRNEDIRFLLIGDGVARPALEETLRREHLDNVTFLPPVPKQEMGALLAQADIFWLQFRDSPLYRWGVSPNKLYDYLYMAKPLVYGANLVKNAVAEAQAGITVPPGDGQALANAILALEKLSPAERDALGARGRAYVLEHHDFVLLGKKLANVMREVAA